MCSRFNMDAVQETVLIWVIFWLPKGSLVGNHPLGTCPLPETWVGPNRGGDSYAFP